jgi:hypothetical protein
MLTFQLIGAAFLLLCLAPLLTRDPTMRRPASLTASHKARLPRRQMFQRRNTSRNLNETMRR